MSLTLEYFKVFTIIQNSCYGSVAITPFVQLFSSGIMQFLYSDKLSFDLMYT